MDQSLMFSEHIGRFSKQAGKKLNALGRMSDMLSTEERLTLVRSFILCHFNFCPTVWTFCGVTDTKKTEKIQERALRFVYGTFNSMYKDIMAGPVICK